MDSEATTDRPVRSWGDVWSALTPALLSSRRQRIAVAALFFVIALSLFWYLGPQKTAFPSHVNVANAFLHGRLDLLPELSNRITEPALIADDPLDWDRVLEVIDEQGYSGFISTFDGGKIFVNHPPLPAIIILPAVALFGGLAFNETLASVIVGALTAPVVFAVTRRLTEKLTVQIWLTVLFVFGTIFWYTASHGGVWFFSHTVAVLFLFLAIYVTLTNRNPLLAGLLLGAAFWSRPTTILALPFFVIMFSDQWLPQSNGTSLLRRIDLRPLLLLGAGVGTFVLSDFIYNYLRFGTPLNAGYTETKIAHTDTALFSHGQFHMSYISRHVPIVFERLPRFTSEAPYVTPSWSGMAIWASTPAFFYALFAGIRNKRVIALGSALIFITMAIITIRTIAKTWDLGWASLSFTDGLTVYPFLLLIALAIIAGIRNKLIIACWAAIIPIALTLFVYAATGWAQFGYRYALDFYPFLFLLTLIAIGDNIRWHHKSLILIGVLVNFWAVLWIYNFDAHGYLGLRWVGF